MHVDAEVAQENPRVVLGMFLVNSTPASVLFDSGASHSFITSQFVAQHNIPISPMSRHMLVTSPGGELKAIYKCDNIHLKIVGRDFRATLIILDSKGIDVILGMGWLTACDAVIQCAKRSVLLTSPAGERFEFAADPAPSNASAVNKLDGAALEDIRVVCDYLMCFLRSCQVCPLTEMLSSLLIFCLVLLLSLSAHIECLAISYKNLKLRLKN
jgi:hypothetical protein